MGGKVLAGAQSERTSYGGPTTAPEDVTLPDVVPRPDQPGRYTNQLKFIRYNVLDAIYKMPESDGFKQPVDPERMMIPTYYQFVKRPMDLGTIRKRITHKYYWSAEECLEDFQRIFGNAYVYNPPESDVIRQAHHVEQVLIAKLSEMPEEEEEIESLSASLKGRDPCEMDTVSVPSPGTPMYLRRTDARNLATSVKDYSSGSESSSDADSEGESDDGEPESRMNTISVEKVKIWQQTQLKLLNQQMNIMKQQMEFLSNLEIEEVKLSPKRPSSSISRKRKSDKSISRPGVRARILWSPESKCYKEPERKKTRVAVSVDEDPVERPTPPPVIPSKPKPVNVTKNVEPSATVSSNSVSVTPKPLKPTSKPKKKPVDTSKPMTIELVENLQNDINKLLPEDFDEVVSSISHYNDDLGDNGELPIDQLPAHFQWELRQIVADKLATSVRFERSPSPESPSPPPTPPEHPIVAESTPDPSKEIATVEPVAVDLGGGDMALQQDGQVYAEDDDYDLLMDEY